MASVEDCAEWFEQGFCWFRSRVDYAVYPPDDEDLHDFIRYESWPFQAKKHPSIQPLWPSNRPPFVYPLNGFKTQEWEEHYGQNREPSRREKAWQQHKQHNLVRVATQRSYDYAHWIACYAEPPPEGYEGEWAPEIVAYNVYAAEDGITAGLGWVSADTAYMNYVTSSVYEVRTVKWPLNPT